MPDETPPTGAPQPASAVLPPGAQEFLESVGHALQRAREVARDLPGMGGIVRVGEVVAESIVTDFDMMAMIANELRWYADRARQCSHDIGVADALLEVGPARGCAFGDLAVPEIVTLNEKARRTVRPARATLMSVAAALTAAADLVERDRTDKARAAADGEAMLKRIKEFRDAPADI